ncbi:sensor histidine kinase [Amycolatopsis sp. NPDC051102]|uniref:ATP-binding protein n=1 Tax=Amycolatopsis sp. NPDC051102 TaxID=3155163 RepID=UPI0034325548
MPVDADAETLNAVLRDLVALSALPAMWVGREPSAVAAGLADTLVELLQVDFAFVRLRELDGAGAVDVTRGSAWQGFPDWLARHAATSVRFQATPIVVDVGDAPAKGVVLRIGVDGEGGLVAAASERPGFPTAFEQLLLSLAANHAATAFENARLIQERRRAEEALRDARDQLEVKVAERTAELGRSRAELAASRARIVTAADETRRRIERDLHDGVQQQLVTAILELRAIEAAVSPTDRLKDELTRAANGLANALDELVEISRGIHPAVLAKGGLTPALKTLARRSPVPVDLDLRTRGRLPAPLEVAAYYVVSEALTNIVKHAHASTAQVTVAIQDDILELAIRDNGRGGADPSRGSGLIGLTDRVEALDGTIGIASPVGEGTTLTVSLPIGG